MSKPMIRVVSIHVVLTLCLASHLTADSQEARLRVTHRDLVPRCLGNEPLDGSKRSWTFAPGPMTMAFTMRSPDRPERPAPPAAAGTAAVSFTVEPGHRYEVEVRADQTAFSTRDWRTGRWRPVVRDRTTDRIVSSDPEWTESCGVRPR